MKKIKWFIAVVAVMCMSVSGVFASLSVKDMKIAVIWNPNTYNTDAPFHWDVGNGGNDIPLKPGGAYDPAPEIAHAQLKFFLSALLLDESGNTSLPGDYKTLDTTGTPTYGYAANIGLEHVMIYNSDDNIDYDRIERDLEGKPNAIVYIGAGASIESNKEEMFGMFKKAAEEGVGIFLIGQRSVTDARDLDPTRETFPVMGVQDTFSVKLYSGEEGVELKEFRFLQKPDEEQIRKVADTVILRNTKDTKYTIHRKRDNFLIYESGTKDNDGLWNNDGKWYGNVINPRPQVLHGNTGEWSIRAEAVEVIEYDDCDAQMNSGFHYEKTIWIAAVGNIVWMVKTSQDLILNGITVIKGGTSPATNLTALNLNTSDYIVTPLRYDQSRQEVEEDWIIRVRNPESGGMDSILVLRKGEKIAQRTSNDPDSDEDYNTRTHFQMFNAGGLRDLRINVSNKNLGSYGNIFKHNDIKDKTVLNFKPYGSSRKDNGRLQARASIWAFNNLLNLQNFDNMTCFDDDVYYVDFLGDQHAGKSKSGYGQFIRPYNPGKNQYAANTYSGEFWESANFFLQDELPATDPSVNGLGINGDYYKNFKGKQFNQIAVVQRGRQRLAIVGFQPTYLEDAKASRALLHDLTKWIGYNHYLLPTASVDKPDNAYIHVDNGTIKVEFDPSPLSDEMKKHNYTLYAKVEYGNQVVEHSKTIVGTQPDKVTITFGLNGEGGDKNINIESERSEFASIRITTSVIGDDSGCFDGVENSITINIRQLFVETCIEKNCGNNKPKETTSNDTLIVNVSTKDPNERPEDPDIIRVIVKDKNGNTVLDTTLTNGDNRIPFANLPEGELEITVWAEKNGYVKSPEEKFTVTNFPDNEPPYIVDAKYRFGQFKDKNVGVRHSDTLIVTFNEHVIYEGENVFWLWDKDEKKFYSVKVQKIKDPVLNADGTETWTFIVISIEDNREPISGDLININPESKMHDKYKNFVGEDNPKKLLDVGPKPISVTVDIIFGKDVSTITDGMSKGSIVIIGKPNQVVENVLNPGETGKKGGSIIIINPGSNVSSGKGTGGVEIEEFKAVVLDVVGNRVAETSLSEPSTNLGHTVMMFGDKSVMVVAWNNKNSEGRDVGAGTYMLLVETKWVGNPTTFREQRAIPVHQIAK